MSSFAQRLTLLRENKDLKKKDLAQVLNVSAACISQYESGTSMPGIDILAHMAQYFGVSIDYLLGNEGSFFDLSQVFCDKTTYLELIYACSQVPFKNRGALLTVINAMKNER